MIDDSDPEAGFLEQLGQRVRTMRALRGMSRRWLAKVSGISERYIAQLEGGKGNVSIVLLRRVSNAMGAHLEDLIPSAIPRRLAGDPAISCGSLARPDRAGQGLLCRRRMATHRRTSFAGHRADRPSRRGKSTLRKILRRRSAGPSSS